MSISSQLWLALAVVCVSNAAGGRGHGLQRGGTRFDTRERHGTAAARHLAMLHAAIYDAVNGVFRTHEAYLVAPAALT